MIKCRRPRNQHHIGMVTQVAVLLAAVIGVAAWDNAPASAMTILPVNLPGKPLNYTKCADEGGTCVAQGLKYLAFGANGKFYFRNSFPFSNISCDRTTFGGDPAPGVVKACYFANYEFKASETESTGTSGLRNVAFGANGSFYFADINGGFTCNAATFGGDPAPGIVKSCYDAVSDDYAFGVVEGGTLTGLNNTPIAYGANGNFFFTVASNSFFCSNTSFGGSDPAQNVVKACYTWSHPFITNEGNPFNAGSVNTLFYFGSGLNGNFILKALSGTATCNTATFGGDPDFGQFKHCYGSPQ